MGVDTRIVLHPSAKIQDVSFAIGFLMQPRKKYLEDNGYIVGDAQLEVLDWTNDCTNIIFKDINGESRDWLYHYMLENHNGRPGLCPRSNLFSIVMGCKLIDIFGGDVVYYDSDGDIRYSNKKPLIDPKWHDNKKNRELINNQLKSIIPITKDYIVNLAKKTGLEDNLKDPECKVLIKKIDNIATIYNEYSELTEIAQKKTRTKKIKTL